jgi:hypothetical protein
MRRRRTSVSRRPESRDTWARYGSLEMMAPSWQELEEPTFPQTGEGQRPRKEHKTGLATPAVQRGSVPQRLFFAAPQRIAITLSPNYY